MKLNIKTLAASLLVGLSLVSCNNDFDEDGGKTTYILPKANFAVGAAITQLRQIPHTFSTFM